MKIALCLFGQPRWLENPFTYQSLKDRILSKYDNVDVYMHIWITPPDEHIETYFNGGNWQPAKGKGVELVNAKEILLDKYAPKKYKFEKQKHFDSIPGAEKVYWYQKENELPLISRIYSANESIKLIENPDSYDFIILTRTDIYYDTFPDLYSIKDEGLWVTDRYSGFTDVVILGTPTYMKYLLIESDLSELVKSMPIFTPEELLKSIYYSHTTVPPKHINMNVGIVRSNTLEEIQY